MFNQLKILIRDSIPPGFQVPLKYWYDVGTRHSEPEMALLSHLVRKERHVVDIGGNRGTYAYRLKQLGARLEVFEPNPDCARVLSAWAKGKKEVRVHAVGLSDKSGRAILHVPIDEHGVEHDSSASIDAELVGKSRDLDIHVRDLDSFGFRDLDFIKIDTEGHETRVLAGAFKTIAASLPAMLIEIEQRHNPNESIDAIFDRIANLGYVGFYLSKNALRTIDCFEKQRDQSPDNFSAGGRYINNFLFLASSRIADGQYSSLVDSGTQA